MSDLDNDDEKKSKRKFNTKMKSQNASSSQRNKRRPENENQRPRSAASSHTNEFENRIGPHTGAIRRHVNSKPQTSHNSTKELIKNWRGISPERYSDNNKSQNKKVNLINSKQNKNPNFPKYTNNPEENVSIQNDNCMKTYSNNKSKVSIKGYRYLESLLSKETTDLLAILAHSKSGFLDILRQNSIKPDWMIIIINLLARLTETSFVHLRVPILTGSCEPNFLNQLNITISKLPTLKKDKNEILQFIENILKFIKIIFETLPHQVTKFEDILIALDLNIEGIKKYKQIILPLEMNDTFSRLQQQYFDVKKESENKSNKPESKKTILPPNDFRNLSLNPTLEDIIEKNPFIRSNIRKGAYDDVEHYLDVQFRLLKEDFIQPLRTNINNFKEKSSKLRNIYNNTQFISSQVVNGTLGYVLKFELKSKKIDLSLTQKFMYGSLLAFSDDEFKTIFFGTVADRKDLKEGTIIVSLIYDQIPLEGIYQRTFVMVESDVYFEPYYHVMKKIQNMNTMNFPLEKYIIYGNTMVDPPKYLNDSIIDIHPYKFSVLNKDVWPSATSLELDESQYKAFQMALTSELCLIQGPPGTGKTFIGLKIANVLLTNFRNLGLKTPILIVCYTNHALDQFLEGILQYTKHLVRIGGRSKSEILADYNLAKLKRNVSFNNNKGLYIDSKNKLNNLVKDINQINFEIKSLNNNPKGVISLNSLKNIIPDEVLEQFPNERLFLQWLEMDLNIDIQHSLDVENLEQNEQIESEDAEDEFFDIDDNIPDYIIKDNDVDDDTKHSLQSLQFAFNIEETNVEIMNLLREMKIYSIIDLKDEFAKIRFYGLNEEYLLKKSKMDYFISKLKQYNSSENYSINFDYHNIWKLNSHQRWKLYFSWVTIYINQLQETVVMMENDYFQVSKEFEEVKVMEELYILKQVHVIGMTTTMAAKYNFLLHELKTKIVIVEEAAEIMEAHIIASLSEHCEHLILIGDHQQLKPKIANYNLGREHNFDISLFERLILNNIDNSILKTQHRMRPEICSLIVPSIYKELKNHYSVCNFNPILGISSNVAFLTHNIREKESKEKETSHINEFEADFLLQLCQYLILQGYTSDKITILTPYSGQMFLIKKKSYNLPLINNVRITVVDNFQGEENDIILLSLVRSNPESDVGFLKIANRVCVALSRAKKGLYIIGNMQNLTHKGTIWIEIKEALLKLNAVNPFMLLRCQIHPDQITKVATNEDFFKIPEGGCTLQCNTLLKCGHNCKSVCHTLDREHYNKKCYEKCERDPPSCNFDHNCLQLCFENCNLCQTKVRRTLKCGHEVDVQCHLFQEPYQCIIKVKTTLKVCEHEVWKQCYIAEEKFKCTYMCEERLPCGHACILKCHKTKDPDHLEYICKKPCARKNNNCSQNHECQKTCVEECGECDFEIEKKRFCGHIHKTECSKNINNEEFYCHKPCKKMIPSCGHHCKNKCSDPCNNCRVKAKKLIEECGHFVTTFCSKIPNKTDCIEACERILPCGHSCQTKCSLNCTTNCKVKVKSIIKSDCGHEINIPCYLNNKDLTQNILLLYCTQPCNTMLSCEHFCKGTCATCFQGRIHEFCKEKCGRVLICGHECDSPCAVTCPPCRKKCRYRCTHSKCKNHCGTPCYSCNERCTWTCKHERCSKKCFEYCNREPCYEPCQEILPCKHKCIGFCGDPCPKLCRICNKEEVETIIFGNEDEPEAKFVLLEDCNHIIESEALETWLKESSEIQLKTCPLCKTTILKNKRYSNIIKEMFEKISLVKNKCFGNYKDNENLKSRLITEVEKLTLHNNGFDKKEFKLLLTHLEEKLLYRKNKRGKGNLSFFELNIIETKIEFIREIFSHCYKSPKSKLELTSQIHMFFTQLVKLDKLSEQAMNDFNNELLRFQRLCELLKFNDVIHTDETRNKYIQVQKILYSLEKYNKEIDKIIKIDLDYIAKNLNLPLTNEERKEILKAMGFVTAGHWYQCPNGHVYAIGECGGAMQESKCNECGASIGGSQHRLLNTNTVATIMDGATRPAYPDNDYFLARNMI